MHRLIELGVNIDHVATLRQARRTYEPDPVWAAAAAELGGADGITVHLREDRRHIQDRDLRLLKETVACKLNLELACDADVVQIACETKPEQATLVPERREEVTTEGGLDLVGRLEAAKRSIGALREAGVVVSLFLDPDPRQLEIAFGLGIEAIELHTGQYALAKGEALEQELVRLVQAGESIVAAGVRLHAGHGLNYRNVRPVAAIPRMQELNIGHSIVSRSVFVGLTQAVREMKELLLLEEKPEA